MKKEYLHSHSSRGKSAFLPAACASNTWGIGFLSQTVLCHTNPLNRTNTADVTAEGKYREGDVQKYAFVVMKCFC